MAETDWSTTSFAQRLEHVRVNLARESYAGFRRRLIGDERDGRDGFDVHYNTVINYHTVTEVAEERREPSLEYVMRVCKVLSIRPAWLLFGEGEPTAADMATDPATDRRSDPEVEAVTAAIEQELGITALNAGVHWTRLAFFAAGHIKREETGDSSIAPLIRRVARALRAPLDSLEIDHTQVEMLDTYLAIVAGAMEWVFSNSDAPRDNAPKEEE